MNQTPQNTNVEAAYRVSIIIWFAILVSQFFLLLVLFFYKGELFKLDFSKPLLGENAPFIIVLAFVAVSTVLLSFIIKSKLRAQAINQQNPALLQTGTIIALALCESASLFGLVLAFAFDYPYFFLWFALGILGILLHFPRRENFIAASYKK